MKNQKNEIILIYSNNYIYLMKDILKDIQEISNKIIEKGVLYLLNKDICSSILSAYAFLFFAFVKKSIYVW